MKQAFSSKWKASKRPGKQRKYVYQADLHLKSKFLSVHLAKELIKKYNKRSITVRTGDKVKILRGQYKGRENKVEKVDHKNVKVFVTGIERAKKDGSKSQIPIQASNLQITELNLSDKKRKQRLEGKNKPSKSKTVEK